ncbi:phosphoinositide 3-kinase adapter protein 1 [Brachionichthys hirsutus]|uniref:phosphoinositide 3-kinase adapter protein 1 n=1 Tax=Brachionichthys hirsutus TaxID=412623 RepID=UPI0036048CD6
MEEPTSTIKSADPGSVSTRELLILYTADAHKWATYLQKILTSSGKLRKSSIFLCALDPAGRRHGFDLERARSCKCTVLLLMGEMLDRIREPELLGGLQTLLCPPHSVVALTCSTSEDSAPMDIFEDWSRWKRLSAEDEPAVYVSTILESLSESRRAENDRETETAATAESHDSTAAANPTADHKGEATSSAVKADDPVSSEATGGTPRLTCLTVQPSRVLCGQQQTLHIIFICKVDDESLPEVEFSPANGPAKRVPGTLENEYTISVSAPDMPAGEVSLTMREGQSRVSLRSVTYYTDMGAISRHFENAASPVNFLCQAFNLTCNAAESVDEMLAGSLTSKMPATGLRVFGVRQIEVENMAAYQRTEELPTLLHFAAKYGLKKLTAVLLRCPGALQAYSVMNKHGDYPNTLAEKSGFSDLRQFMDEFVETEDMLQSHSEEPKEDAEVYEFMSNSARGMMMRYPSCSEDVYESMLEISPECADDLYEAMSEVVENPEEFMLRTFFQGKPDDGVNLRENEGVKGEGVETDDLSGPHRPEEEEEEDPYNRFLHGVYDTVNNSRIYSPILLNRAPAPTPRPESECGQPVIFRVFSDKDAVNGSTAEELGYPAGPPVTGAPSSTYDPYAGMKTPGQRQLISLQERVKVGEITVDDAVREFQAWKFDHKHRSSSLRYQKGNLKLLRDSIIRRHKSRQRSGKELDFEISAPLQRKSSATLERSEFEPIPGAPAASPPPPLPLLPPPHPAAPQTVQRGGWKTGSTSSTSSTESNRLSTHSTLSSGTEPDFEDIVEVIAPPPRPLRSSDAAALLTPPRVPPRLPERSVRRAGDLKTASSSSRTAETTLHERYVSCPTRALPRIPSQRRTSSTPPIPRRLR